MPLRFLSPLLLSCAVATANSGKAEADWISASATVEPGQSLHTAIRLKHDVGWKSYWINPGEAGIPTRVEWKLPPGWKHSGLKFPVPTRFSSSGLSGFGYHEPAKMAELAAAQGNKASHFLMDTDGSVGKAYDAKVTPHMFIIAADGKLAYDGAIDSKATTAAEDVATADKLFVNALEAVLAGKEVAAAKNKPYGCGVKY